MRVKLGQLLKQVIYSVRLSAYLRVLYKLLGVELCSQ